MRAWELVKLALEGVRRTPLRVALTSLGVAIATGALVSMVAFAEGLQHQAEKPFEELDLLNRIEVRSEPDEKKDDKKPDADAPALDDAALARLRGIPGVEIVYPDLTKTGIEIAANGKSERTFVTSLPREAAGLAFVRRLIKAGRFFDAGDSKEILVGTELTKSLGFAKPEDAVGREAVLTASGLVPSPPMGFRFEKSDTSVRIAGVWEGPGWLGRAMGNSVLAPLDLVKTLPGIPLDAAMSAMRRGKPSDKATGGGVIVRTRRANETPDVDRAIRALGYKTDTFVSRLDEMKRFFIVLDVLLGAVGAVALVVAGLGIVNTLLMAVLERTREIGAYKAIGASDGDVRLVFLAEAALVGVLGGIGGVLLGRGVSAAIGVGIGIYARSKDVTQPIAVFAFPFWLLAGAVLFAVAASVVSGVYPAARASRVDPIRALRGE